MERGISGRCPAGLRAQLATTVVTNALSPSYWPQASPIKQRPQVFLKHIDNSKPNEKPVYMFLREGGWGRKKDTDAKRERPKLIRQSATLAAPALVVAAQSWRKCVQKSFWLSFSQPVTLLDVSMLPQLLKKIRVPQVLGVINSKNPSAYAGDRSGVRWVDLALTLICAILTW